MERSKRPNGGGVACSCIRWLSWWWLISTVAIAVIVLRLLALSCSLLDQKQLYTSAVRLRDCQPFEIHLGATDDPTAVRVTWRTHASQSCPSTVRYRLPKATTQQEAEGFEYIGEAALFCGGTASTYDYRLHFHTAVLTGLKPDTDYLYQLPLDSQEYRFRSGKAAGDKTPFVFFALADTGVARGEQLGALTVELAIAEIVDRNGFPDFFLDVGDLAKADGVPSHWELFMTQIAPFAMRRPWMVAMGNHEYDIQTRDPDPWGIIPYQPEWGNMEVGTSDGECGLPTFWRFPTGLKVSPEDFELNAENQTLPVPPTAAPFPPFYYSFRHGTVHVVVVSTEHDVEEESHQMQWLRTELERVDRCLTPFLVVAAHRPFYAPRSHPGDYQTGLGLMKRLEPLFLKYRVDVMISGHGHYYYRPCEVKGGVCVQSGEGLVSIVLGNGGHPLGALLPGDYEFEDMVSDLNWGFGRFRVQGDERMDYEYIRADGCEVKDRYVFLNQQLCQTRQL